MKKIKSLFEEAASTSVSKLRPKIARLVLLSLLSSGISLPLYATTATANVVQQNTRMVKGVVKDSNGETVIGAAVQLKNNTIGTVTNENGEFSLSVPVKNAVLMVSYLGYKTQEVPVSGRDMLQIKLVEDNQQLDEVVVVGYGTQRKATVTGSITSIKGEELKRSPEANLTNSLVGRMAGVIANNRSGEPGSDYSDILIRGKATLGNTQPLFVIDGVANRWGNIDRLNPSDIESMTVLKDASAAIYGSQAANGVILVTTKRGSNSKPTITYEGSFGLSQNTRTPKLMNAYQYMVYEDEINAADFPTDITKQRFKDVKGQYLDGTIDRNVWGDTDWMGVVFQKSAPKTQHSLAVRGGTERVKYYISGAYLYQEPCYKNTTFDFSTFQLRSNIDANITKDLTVTLELATRQESRNESNYSTSNLFWEAFNAYPYLHDYYDNGLPGPGISWGNNIAIMAQGQTGYYKVRDNYINSKVGADLKMPWITPGLYVGAYVAFDKQFRGEKTQNGMWNAYRYDKETGNYENIYETTGQKNINLSERNDSKSMTTVVAKVGYDRRFEQHSVNAFVAYEQSREEGDWFSGWRRDFYNQEVDYLFAGGDREKTNDGNTYISARQNIFGRLSYGFMDRYLAEFTLRRDGSMNFPKDKRWGWFPGLSLGWRITEESFMDNVKFLNELKLKGSVGQLGNDRVDPFQYLESYNIQNGAQFGTDPKRGKGFTLGRIPNKNITWEVATTYNIGFESQFFNGLLSFDAQYFFAKRDKILITRQASIPDYTGLTLPDENIGKIQNQGFEIETAHRNKIGNFTYYVGGNFTFARNEIIFFDEAENTPDWQKRTGFPIDSYLVYLSDGIFQDNKDLFATKARLPGSKPGDIRYQNIDGDMAITDRDKKRIYESPVPQIVYGITLGGTWKGIELNVLFQGQALAKTMIQPYTYNRDVDYFENRWISKEATPNAKYPRAFSKDDPINKLPSDFWLRDASFLRLKNLEIAYNLKSEWLKKVKMESARIYVSGSNLLTFDKIKLQDPEGVDQGGLYYPQQRIFNIGVNVSF